MRLTLKIVENVVGNLLGLAIIVGLFLLVNSTPIVSPAATTSTQHVDRIPLVGPAVR